MVTYAVYDEVNASFSQPLFLVTEEDLELKKLLWTQIFHVCNNPNNAEARDIIMQKNFLKCLLMYLDVAQKDNPVVVRWRPPQLLELQIHALNIIGHLTEFVPQHIHEIGGHQILAVFLKKYKDNSRRKACMRAILCASKFEFFKLEF
jgi:hypothetical protein